MKKEVINLRQHWRLLLLPATPSTISRYWLQESSGNRGVKMNGLNVEMCVTVTRLSILNDPCSKKSILRNAIRNSSSLHVESVLFLAFHRYCGFFFRATTKIKHILMCLFEEPTVRLQSAALPQLPGTAVSLAQDPSLQSSYPELSTPGPPCGLGSPHFPLLLSGHALSEQITYLCPKAGSASSFTGPWLWPCHSP